MNKTIQLLIDSYFDGNISYVRSSIASKQLFASVVYYMLQTGLYTHDELEKFIYDIGVNS
jgi:hypothetical protein